MKAGLLSMAAAAAALMLTAAPVAGQQGTAPKPQNPPASKPPVAAPAAPAHPLEPPAPFPADSKMAFVDMQEIASNSVLGKAASSKLNEAIAKHQAEIAEKNKALQQLTQKRDAGGAVLSQDARAQLDKDIDKAQREIQFMQQSAQADMNTLQTDLTTEFQKKVVAIVTDLGKERGLYAIFSSADAGAMYLGPGLDLSAEVVKRLDASAGGAK